jgi:hypothetical protein
MSMRLPRPAAAIGMPMLLLIVDVVGMPIIALLMQLIMPVMMPITPIGIMPFAIRPGALSGTDLSQDPAQIRFPR